jgi:hypothetical protein
MQFVRQRVATSLPWTDERRERRNRGEGGGTEVSRGYATFYSPHLPRDLAVKGDGRQDAERDEFSLAEGLVGGWTKGDEDHGSVQTVEQERQAEEEDV